MERRVQTYENLRKATLFFLNKTFWSTKVTMKSSVMRKSVI